LDIRYWVSGIRNGFAKIEKNTYRKSDMGPDLKGLENKLKELEMKIKEVKKRMPAHSIKPPIMMELFELEDERDLLEAQILQLEKEKE
jgi:hypothetical protein